MVFEFKLPDIGEGVHEGEISKWLVQPGQSVYEDEPMVEVMTDKVTVEITSPVAGAVKDLHYKKGDVVKVGQVIITIDKAAAGETKSAAETQAHAENGGKTSQPVAVAERPQGDGKTMQRYESQGPSSKVLAAPAVRKLARSMGVDLTLISGSGPHGRVQKADVLSFTPEKGVSTPSLKPQRPHVAGARHAERIPFVGMRRKIAEHLVKSKHTAPHFTYVEEVDMTDIVKFRNDLQPHAEVVGVKLTYLPFIMKAVIEGLKKYPVLNSSLDEAKQEIVLKQYYNLGVAVATEDGLIVPVVKDADQLSLMDLAVEITDLSEKARQGKLSLSDLQGGTFTLTSIGSIGGIFSAPIINYPEVAIMGIQKIEKRPVVRNDEIVIREMMYLSISCDHRVVDGMEAALFVKEVVSWLEHPARLLLSAK